MPKEEKSPSAERRYPPFWERAVPIALGVIALVVVVLLIIAIVIVLGLFPAAAA